MRDDSIFATQCPSGQIPTLMINFQERKIKWVDTLAITMVAVYLAQLNKNWKTLWGSNVEKALDFIIQRAYKHEIEDFLVWQFNGFYPADWEDTSFAIFLLVKNNRLKIGELKSLKELLLNNTTEQGTGVWIKDSYSSSNANQNHWDPTSAINILRLHYLLKSNKDVCNRLERFITKNLSLTQFSKTTLYYTPPITAFFAQRLLCDFSCGNEEFRLTAENFYKEVANAISSGCLRATSFERALLNLPAEKNDKGLIFHHGRRTNIWYGSPVLHKLAMV